MLWRRRRALGCCRGDCGERRHDRHNAHAATSHSPARTALCCSQMLRCVSIVWQLSMLSPAVAVSLTRPTHQGVVSGPANIVLASTVDMSSPVLPLRTLSRRSPRRTSLLIVPLAFRISVIVSRPRRSTGLDDDGVESAKSRGSILVLLPALMRSSPSKADELHRRRCTSLDREPTTASTRSMESLPRPVAPRAVRSHCLTPVTAPEFGGVS